MGGKCQQALRLSDQYHANTHRASGGMNEEWGWCTAVSIIQNIEEKGDITESNVDTCYKERQPIMTKGHNHSKNLDGHTSGHWKWKKRIRTWWSRHIFRETTGGQQDVSEDNRYRSKQNSTMDQGMKTGTAAEGTRGSGTGNREQGTKGPRKKKSQDQRTRRPAIYELNCDSRSDWVRDDIMNDDRNGRWRKKNGRHSNKCQDWPGVPGIAKTRVCCARTYVYY